MVEHKRGDALLIWKPHTKSTFGTNDTRYAGTPRGSHIRHEKYATSKLIMTLLWDSDVAESFVFVGVWCDSAIGSGHREAGLDGYYHISSSVCIRFSY